MHRQLVIFTATVSLSALVSCNKEKPRADSAPVAGQTMSNPRAQTAKAPAGVAQGLAGMIERATPHFKFENLIHALGGKIPRDMAHQMEAEAVHVAGLGDFLGKDMMPYVLDFKQNGSLVMYRSGQSLRAFGYSYSRSLTSEGDPAEQSLLSDFNLEKESEKEVLDNALNPTTIQVKWYVHKTRPAIRAVSYMRVSATLVFYDSSEVEGSKLLPGSPDEVGREKIQSLKDRYKNLTK